MALMILPFFLQVASTAPVPQDSLYSPQTVIGALVGLVIAVAGWLIVGLLKEAVATMKAREAKMDTLLEEIGKKLTTLEKNDAIREYASSVVDARIFKLEAWREDHCKEHHS